MYYAEIVFLESFCKECFILLFILTLLRFDSPRKRIIAVSFGLGITSVFLPFAPRFIMVIIFVFRVLVAPVFCLRRTLKNEVIFIILHLLLGLIDFPFLFSICGLCLSVCLKNFTYKSIGVNKNYYDCVVFVGNKKVNAVAFFDSGNRIFAKNGEPVVLVDKALYNRFDGEEQDVCFSTVSGMGVTPCRSGGVSVYCNGKWVEQNAMIALSPKKIKHYGVILHGDMLL